MATSVFTTAILAVKRDCTQLVGTKRMKQQYGRLNRSDARRPGLSAVLERPKIAEMSREALESSPTGKLLGLACRCMRYHRHATLSCGSHRQALVLASFARMHFPGGGILAQVIAAYLTGWLFLRLPAGDVEQHKPYNIDFREVLG